MPNQVRLDALRTRAMQRANREGDDATLGFLTKAEWNGLLDAAWRELWDLLVTRYQDQYAKSVQFNITAATDTYSFTTIGAADFYKALGVDMQVNGQFWQPLKRFSFSERGMGNPLSPLLSGIPGLLDLRYQLRGDAVVFMQPVPSITVKLWYVPTAQCLVNGIGSPTSATLTNDADTIDDVNGYGELVVVIAAINALLKEESDVSALMAEKQMLLQRIHAASAIRDTGATERIADVSGYDWS
jgi:hypothetical protein